VALWSLHCALVALEGAQKMAVEAMSKTPPRPILVPMTPEQSERLLEMLRERPGGPLRVEPDGPPDAPVYCVTSWEGAFSRSDRAKLWDSHSWDRVTLTRVWKIDETDAPGSPLMPGEVVLRGPDLGRFADVSLKQAFRVTVTKGDEL
jgi:hypothetical protein